MGRFNFVTKTFYDMIKVVNDLYRSHCIGLHYAHLSHTPTQTFCSNAYGDDSDNAAADAAAAVENDNFSPTNI